MAFTRTWDETSPPGSSDADLIDDFIRNNKTDLRERIAALFRMDLLQFTADPIEPQGIDWSAVATVVSLGPTTSQSWRNNADSADNMLLDDLGNLTLRKDISAVGGMAACLEGWKQTTIPASQAATEQTRTLGRWIAPRSGSLLGIALQVGAGTSCTAGTFTATAWKSVVDSFSAHNDVSLGVSCTLTTSTPNVNNTAVTKDGTTFNANDELFFKFATDASWAPTTLTVRAVMLVEF